MAATNFGRMQTNERLIWSKDLWAQARNDSFIGKFLGTSENSVIQRITELKKDEKGGTKCVLTLVADLVGDGVAGDNQLKGREEAMKQYDTNIRYDQLRHGVANEGRMADQKSVVRFRDHAKNKLSYWLSERIDQMAFLTMAGWQYNLNCDGSARVNSELPFLEFAADVKAATSGRFARWNGTSNTLEWGVGTSAVAAADKIKWNMFIDLKAMAKKKFVKGVREAGGEETYHVFLNTIAMSILKKDPDYVANLRYAQTRDKENPLFSGTTVKIDNLYIHEYRNVPNTLGAAPGSKWGAGGAVDGSIVLFCGAQALGMADLGEPGWEEEADDYNNRQGIATDKMFGLLKPQFKTIYELDGAGQPTLQDFGVISVYTAL